MRFPLVLVEISAADDGFAADCCRYIVTARSVCALRVVEMLKRCLFVAEYFAVTNVLKFLVRLIGMRLMHMFQHAIIMFFLLLVV